MIDLGAKIRNLRLANSLTLAELAARTELTTGFLSQLENNVSSPSISTLSDVLEALGSNLSEFFQEETTEKKVFSENDFFENVTDDYIINWLVPDAQKRDMEPIRIQIKPKSSSQTIRPHGGEEFGYVLKGNIYLNYGKEKLQVKEGQTFYVDGHRSHHLSNETNQEAIVLWISTPPLF